MMRFQDIRHLTPLIGTIFPKINEGGHFEVLRHIASGSLGAVPLESFGRCIERQDWLYCQDSGKARKQPLKLKSAGSDYSAPHAQVSDCKDDYYYTAPCRCFPHCWAFRKKGLDPVVQNPSCHRTKMLLEPTKESYIIFIINYPKFMVPPSHLMTRLIIKIKAMIHINFISK